VEIKGFLTIFADPGPYLWLTDLDPGDPKTYGSYGSGTLGLSIRGLDGFHFGHHRVLLTTIAAI
jgi:hypothetical protein